MHCVHKRELENVVFSSSLTYHGIGIGWSNEMNITVPMLYSASSPPGPSRLGLEDSGRGSTEPY